MFELLVKKLVEHARVPEYAYSSAGYDIWARMDYVIPPGEAVQIMLGFAAAFTPGYVAVVDDRSSVGKACVTHLAGVIDPDYRGEWSALMFNLGSTPYEVSINRAIAQILFLKVEKPTPVLVTELPTTLRGASMFGSSDLKGTVKIKIKTNRGQQYKHYKGKIVTYMGTSTRSDKPLTGGRLYTARFSDNPEVTINVYEGWLHDCDFPVQSMVLYSELESNELWLRPTEDFYGMVDVDGIPSARFTPLIEEALPPLTPEEQRANRFKKS